MKKCFASIGVLTLTLGLLPVVASAGSVDPVQTYVAECGACHIPFPPDLLPARSWNRLLGNLEEHFGEDASLDPADRKVIASWLESSAADTGGSRRGRWVMRGIRGDQTPLRITQTRTWISAHNEVSPWRWRSEKVKSKANCLACHRR